MSINLIFGWWWILAGLLAGALQGMFFHREDWMGGYASWRRRMMRLGHVAFLGTGILNLLAAGTVKAWQVGGDTMQWMSLALIAGAALMPTICYLAAWRKGFRQLFFIPVICLVGAVGGVTVVLMQAVGR